MFVPPSAFPVAPATFQYRKLSAVVALLLIAWSSATAGYQVSGDTQGNRIHLELTNRSALIDCATFTVEAISTPTWLEITDTQVILERAPEIIIEFTVTGIDPGVSGELELLITAYNSGGAALISISRKLHLTVGEETPEIQRSYRIDECCIPTTGISTEPVLPERHILLGNHPNPFSSSTNIRFGLPRAASVTLNICDITGRCIRHLESPELAAGYHQITWSGKDDRGRYVAPGVYFYQLISENWTHSQKMLLLQ